MGINSYSQSWAQRSGWNFFMGTKTRILIVTDSPVVPTGLAETTRLIFSTLLHNYPEEYDLHQIGLFHCYAVTTPQWPIYPTMAGKGPDGKVRFVPEDKFGQRTFPKCLARIQPDIVFGFGEPHRVQHLCAPPQGRRHRLILYVNFDGIPVPRTWFSYLRDADLIFTKSEFSRDVLASAVPEIPPSQLSYQYSPADVVRFKPVSSEEKASLRRDLLPSWMAQDSFILGWVGRNQWRKQNWVLFKVIHYLRTGAYLVCQRCARVSLLDWDPSRQRHLEGAEGQLGSRPGWKGDICQHCGAAEIKRAEPLPNIYLWLHMPEEPELVWPPELLEQQFGLQRGRDIHYTEGHGPKAELAPKDMGTLFSLWDGLLYLTGGEGFGLPAWEAMCCGLPVVYTNYSSHAEFLGRANAGLPVGGILQPEPQTCIWRMLADVPQAVEAVRRLYFDADLRTALSRNGRSFAERFAPDVQVERWHNVFQQLLKRPSKAEGVGTGPKTDQLCFNILKMEPVAGFGP